MYAQAIRFFEELLSKNRKMDLYQLKTLAAVAELGSLQASRRLHLSHPAASAQIKALERIALFERKPNGLTLTRAGAALLPEIAKLLETAADLALRVKALRGRLSGSIKIAIVSPTVADSSLLRLGDIMNLMVRCHPMLSIEVHNRNARSVVAGICSGEFEAGIALGDRALNSPERAAVSDCGSRHLAHGRTQRLLERHCRLAVDISAKTRLAFPDGCRLVQETLLRADQSYRSQQPSGYRQPCHGRRRARPYARGPGH
jgi:DNA-binding transcriptional LysR family regulator